MLIINELSDIWHHLCIFTLPRGKELWPGESCCCRQRMTRVFAPLRNRVRLGVLREKLHPCQLVCPLQNCTLHSCLPFGKAWKGIASSFLIWRRNGIGGFCVQLKIICYFVINSKNITFQILFLVFIDQEKLQSHIYQRTPLTVGRLACPARELSTPT